MSLVNLPKPLDNIFNSSDDLPQLFDRLMVAMVELLECDRCYLYVRDPELLVGQILHCHCVDSSIPNLKNCNPHSESLYVAEKDPLFAAALQCERPIFIDRLDSISNSDRDIEFFRQYYREQKSLIQAHICSQDRLWGILQASQFNRSRPWTKFDRTVIYTVLDRISRSVTVYVKKHLSHTLQKYGD